MTHSGSDKQTSSAKPGWAGHLFIGFLAFSAIGSLGLVGYFLLCSALWTSNDGAALMGQRGDFFGGFLNPILTTLTFAAFLWTVLMQRAELKASKAQFEASAEAIQDQADAARAQSYQAGVFQLLAMYDNIASSMSIVHPITKATFTGRAAFRVMYSNMRRVYRRKREQFPRAEEEKVLRLAFETLFREEHHQLPHYFRFLYNALRMIEDGPEAAKYVRMLRASISNQELLVLFYNCAISPHGRKFRDLAEKHALFDNISPRLLEPEHANLIAPQAFGPGGYEAIVQMARPVRGDLYEPPEPGAEAPPPSDLN